jgi:ankyrin repeat protein
VEACRVLLAHGADCKLANDEKDTPLAAAEREGHVEVAALLPEQGALMEKPVDKGSLTRVTRGAGP